MLNKIKGKNLVLLLICFLGFYGPNIGSQEAIEPKEFIDLFEKTLKIGDKPNLSPEEIQLITRLKGSGSNGFSSLLSLLTETDDTFKKAQIIRFVANQDGEKKGLFLPIVRSELEEIVMEGQIGNDDLRPLIGTAINFLAAEGDLSDVALIKKFQNSSLTFIKYVSKKGVETLENPVKKRINERNIQNSPKKEAKLDAPTPEPIFVKNPSSKDKKSTDPKVSESTSDNPFPYLIFIIGGVVAVGLIVVLKRK